MKIKRFYWVSAPAGKVAHMLFGKRVEGEKLACGRRVGWPKWKWMTLRTLPRCRDCMAAANSSDASVLVARVRS